MEMTTTMMVMMQQSIANMEQNMVEMEKKMTGMEKMTEMVMMHQVEQGRQLQLQNEQQQQELLQFGAQQLKQRHLLQQLQHFVGYVEMQQRKQKQQQQEAEHQLQQLTDSCNSLWALCRDAARQEQKQRREAFAAKADESSISSSRNVYDGRWSGDAEQEQTE